MEGESNTELTGDRGVGDPKGRVGLSDQVFVEDDGGPSDSPGKVRGYQTAEGENVVSGC